jgi:DNA polymerase-1
MKTEPVPEISVIVSALREAPEFALDLETTGFDPHNDFIRGMSLSIGMRPNQTWWIPFRGPGAVPFVSTMRELAPVLSDPKKIMVGSNPKFDLKFLRVNGVTVTCRVADTIVADWLLDENNRKHGLKEVVSREFGVTMVDYKEASKRVDDLFGDGKFERYAKDDARYALKLWKTLNARLKKEGLDILYWRVEMRVLRVLIEMELAGVHIDIPHLKNMQAEFSAKMAASLKGAYEAVGHEFDVSSPKQVSAVLFDELKLPIQPGEVRGKAGYYSTDDRILTCYNHPVVKAILRHRTVSKLMGTYINPYIEKTRDTLRIFTEFRQAGTRAGRFTSVEPNLQQIPSKKSLRGTIKKMFIPAPGKLFLCGDFNQLQFRLIGHYCKCVLGRSIISDLYQEAGSDLHEKTNLELKLTDRKRAKTVNFAFLFGRGAKSFAEAEHMDQGVADNYYNGFHFSYPEIRQMADYCRNEICTKGYIESIGGRRRRFPEAKGKDPRSREVWWMGWVAWNACIQGSESDLVRLVMANLWEDILARRKKEDHWDEVSIILQVHDELVLEAPPIIACDVMDLMRLHATKAMALKVPISMDVGVGMDWEESKA